MALIEATHVRTLNLFARSGRQMPAARHGIERRSNTSGAAQLAAEYAERAADIESKEPSYGARM